MTPPPSPRRCQLFRFPSDLALAETLATRWIEVLDAAPAGRSFTVALSGGRIARRLLAAAARLGRDRHTDWSRCHFFWGDERGVPPDHPESNFRAAREEFLDPAGIAAGQIHRIAGELPPPEAARQAREELRRHAPANPAGLPILDLVFLGLGEDGHVASLFPDTPDALANSAEIYVPVIGPKPPPRRLSLTYPVLAAARAVWVAASGPGKEQALQTSLAATGTTPLAHLLRQRPETWIFTDLPTPEAV